MSSGELITLVFVFGMSLTAFVISCFQFKEKGFLFNNSYLYASKKERETMDKKPHYRQSAIVFLLVGTAFLFLAIEILFAIKWLELLVIAIIVSMIIYAVLSSIKIESKNK